MLSPADAALVLRDNRLPGLRLVLDADALIEALRGIAPQAIPPGSAPMQVRGTYLRYKPAMSCLAAYEITYPHGRVVLYATAYATGTIGKLRPRHAGIVAVAGSGQSYFVMAEHTVTVCLFPADNELEALWRLTDPRELKRLLRRLMLGKAHEGVQELERLRYKPERRFVGALHTHGERWGVLKAYDRLGFAVADANAAAFTGVSADYLRFPRALVRSLRHQMLLYKWLPGVSMADAMVRGETDIVTSAMTAGMAAATLHGLSPHPLPSRTVTQDLAALAAASRTLIILCPRLTPRVERLATRLRARLTTASSPMCAIHGDFYADQLLSADDGTVALLDLDRAAYGDPSLDLGTFIAHAEARATIGELHSLDSAALYEAMSVGYTLVATAPHPSRVQAYAALGLLCLAVEPFRRRDPEWPTRVEMILERVDALLGQSVRVMVGMPSSSSALGHVVPK